jgi:hypothetical protein
MNILDVCNKSAMTGFRIHAVVATLDLDFFHGFHPFSDPTELPNEVGADRYGNF